MDVLTDPEGFTYEFDLLDIGDGVEVEVKRPKEKARLGSFIHACRFCGYSGQSELGLLPLPANKPAEFCPSCRGAVRA